VAVQNQLQNRKEECLVQLQSCLSAPQAQAAQPPRQGGESRGECGLKSSARKETSFILDAQFWYHPERSPVQRPKKDEPEKDEDPVQGSSEAEIPSIED